MSTKGSTQKYKFTWFNMTLPDFLTHLVLKVFVKTLYRLKTVDSERIPTAGPALLVTNHVSWADALLIQFCIRRRIRFVLPRATYTAGRLQWLFRRMNVILTSETEASTQRSDALKEIRQALENGSVVCYFAEGIVTKNGMLQSFKRWLEGIMEDTDYPIIPLYLGGVWGGRFSYYASQIGWRSRRLRCPVSIHVGQPMHPTSTAYEVRQKVEALSCDYLNSLKSNTGTLAELFIRSARKHWWRPCVADVTGKDLNYGRALIGSILLSRKLTAYTQTAQNIGIMLPPSVGGALANVAVGLLGKTSVNLSYVISETMREEILTQAEVEHVLTSRVFLEKLDLKDTNCRYLFIEDLIKHISGAQKLAALCQARLLPLWAWRRVRGLSPDDTATILFSSGSTGHPKGVVLSHHNMTANLTSMRMVYRLYTNDKLFGVLPFFHAFGLNITLWLPITTGLPAFYVPNPLDGKIVAQGIRDSQATILLTTPTFLQGYMRRAAREDLATLRSVIVGAEKMNPKLATLFEKKYGIRPQEGYGATELSPLVSLNLRDINREGLHQIGTKVGSVGQPVPGVAVKVVCPDTYESLGSDRPGLLLIKAPNLMNGYLHNLDKTREVIRDGWYHTGDIASVDAAGFITITDRLSRFSKIGGEMVSHGKVEEICVQAVRSDDRVVVVTSRRHETKGEELMVLYVTQKVNPTGLIEAVRNSDLPNLCKPKPDNFIPVEAIPLLGSGKPDFMKIKKLVADEA